MDLDELLNTLHGLDKGNVSEEDAIEAVKLWLKTVEDRQ